jgi:hypothetical protein
MKLKPLRQNQHRCAVAIREGLNLWLTLVVERSPEGDVYVLVPRPEEDWNVHASYHVSGKQHIKSYGDEMVSKQGQPLNGQFRGSENVTCFAGHGHDTDLAIYDSKLFDAAVKVAPGVLTPAGGTVCVDLVEPGCQPVTAPTAHKIVQREVFSTPEPHLVITIFSPD